MFSRNSNFLHVMRSIVRPKEIDSDHSSIAPTGRTCTAPQCRSTSPTILSAPFFTGETERVSMIQSI